MAASHSLLVERIAVDACMRFHAVNSRVQYNATLKAERAAVSQPYVRESG